MADFFTGTLLASPVVVGSSGDTNGTHYSVLGVGGYLEIETIDDRNNIPVDTIKGLDADGLSSGRRRLNMLVNVIEEDQIYKLTVPYLIWTGLTETQKVNELANNSNWNIFTVGGTGSGERIEKTFSLTGHGFTIGNVIGFSGGTFVKAIATTEFSGETFGLISEVPDSNSFTVVFAGFVTGITGVGLTSNTTYYLSSTVAGELTSVEPFLANTVSKPILTTLTTGEEVLVFQYRGFTVVTGVTSSGGTGGTDLANIGVGTGLVFSGVSGTTSLLRSLAGSGDTEIVNSGGTIVINSNSLSANNGLTKIGNNIVLGGSLTGDTIINSTFGLAIGNSVTATTGSSSIAFGQGTDARGDNSFAHGYSTISSGNHSHSEGCNTRANGLSSHSEGFNTCSVGNYSHAEGSVTCSIGNASHSEGFNTCSVGNYSHSTGYYTLASGNSSHTGGIGTLDRFIIASGIGSFNHSQNTSGQTINHGALANYSAILGGSNHNIESGNTGATIIGGYGIKLTGTTYANHVAVPQLAIITGLTSGSTGDTILVRDNTTGIIKEIPQSGLTNGDNNNRLINITISANTITTGNEYVIVVDSTSSGLTVTLNATPEDGESYIIKDNGNALTNNITIDGNTKNIDGNANFIINTNDGSVTTMYSENDDEWYVIGIVT